MTYAKTYLLPSKTWKISRKREVEVWSRDLQSAVNVDLKVSIFVRAEQQTFKRDQETLHSE